MPKQCRLIIIMRVRVQFQSIHITYNWKQIKHISFLNVFLKDKWSLFDNYISNISHCIFFYFSHRTITLIISVIFKSERYFIFTLKSRKLCHFSAIYPVSAHTFCSVFYLFSCHKIIIIYNHRTLGKYLLNLRKNYQL